MWMALLARSISCKFVKLSPPFHHWLFQPFFFLPINNILCFPWLSILEHLFFSCFTSCCNINIHHIHICSAYLCLNNRLNLYYCDIFPWNIFCILVNFRQSIILCPFKPHVRHAYEDVLCGFWLGCVTSLVAIVVYFLFFFACLHIVIHHPTIYAMFVSLPCLTLCFH